MKKIQSALISVYHKEGLEPVLDLLNHYGVTIYSTGGTRAFIEKQGIDVFPVEELTAYPSILGGRVKTLHPKIFGGILARRDTPEDVKHLKTYDIPLIDLVIVDLYPFEQTVAQTKEEQQIIEKIDIGGISLIRAAAKNFKDTAVVSNRQDYKFLLDTLSENHGSTTLEDRIWLATKAFDTSSHYDTAIFSYFNQDSRIASFKKSISTSRTLRYGENPHQQGVFYGNLEAYFDKLNGKELSYNNLVDIDAAVHLIAEFVDQAPTMAIFKHTNTCGLASRSSLKEAYLAALSCDNISAFGGVLIANRPIDIDTAEAIHSLFCEVLIAPDYSPEALALLGSKKNRIILRQKIFDRSHKAFKSLLNGVLEQEVDLTAEKPQQFTPVTEKKASPEELDDLAFALVAAKHLKSNTIALVKNKQLIGVGCGQTSRVDALKQAIKKATVFGFDLKGAVMASDAFFPFPDCVEIAHKAGITAVVQPGGSIKDQESIDYCNTHGVAMLTTGVRHFKH